MHETFPDFDMYMFPVFLNGIVVWANGSMAQWAFG